MMPFQMLGTCLFDYGKVFPEDSALGIALINLGQAESKIAALQESLANDVRMGYFATLDEGNRLYKEYDHLKKKLMSRRLDYDAKLNRLSKAKKEKPELEQEMQASRIKYEETEHELIQKMAYIQEFEHEHRDALFGLLEAQLNYHNQAKELLLSIQNNWGGGSFSDPLETMGAIMSRPESYHSISEDNLSTTDTAERGSRRQRTLSVDSSDFSYAQSQVSEMDTPPSRMSSVRQASYDTPNEKYRKAMFDFNSNNDDEISFKAGDLIRVISEIDKGWWVGEVHDERGIFPVNFTDEYDARIQQPLPSLPLNTATNNVSSASINNLSKSSRSNTSAIYNESSASSNNISSSSLLQRSNTSPHIPTTTASGSLSRKHSTAIRPPPPPPSKTQTSSSFESFSSVPSSGIGFSSPVRSQSPTSFHENHSSEYSIDTPCPECDCHQFIANSVKKGYCNTCYHKHI
ncbi:hypothetical protein K501DRAFT_248191 [Backusella circina FSU 941]|nr:hypothetical protein K501DRAFT_248191 [Backusella circina FSU 941]